MLKTILLVFLSGCVGRATSTDDVASKETVPEMIFGVCEIAVEVFGARSIKVLVAGAEYLGLASELIKGLHEDVIGGVTLVDENSTVEAGPGLPLLVLPEGEDAVEVVQRLSNDYIRFPVVLAVVSSDYEPLLAAWPDHTAENALVVFATDSEVGALSLPSWNDFCVREPGVACAPILFDSTNYTKLETVFRKRTRDMAGQPLRITMFKRKFTAFTDAKGLTTGFDGEMLGLFEELFNFSANFTVRPSSEQFGFRHENGTFVGSLGDLVYHKADLSLNGFFLKIYDTKEIAFTTGITSDQLCVVVPASLPIPDWKAVFLCFKKHVWITIAITYFFASVVWYFIKRSIKETTLDLSNTAFSVYRMLLMCPLDKIPANIPERIFVGSVLISSFLIATLFQGSLLKLLSRHWYEKEIRSSEDLVDSRLPIVTRSKNLMDTYDGGDSETIRTLRTRLQYFPEMDGDLVRVSSEHRDLATLGRQAELKLMISTNHTVGGRAKVHIVEDCPRSYHICYAMPRGSFLFETINDMVGRIVSAGLNESPKIQSVFLASTTVSSSGSESATAKPFKISHLQIAFGLLGVGYLISLCVFIIEMFFKSTRKTPKSKKHKIIEKFIL